MNDRELLARIARSAGQKAGYKQLVRELNLGGGMQRRLLLEQLARMTARGALVKIDREQWGIPRAVAGVGTTRDNLAAGRLDLHRDGYGFVRPNARQATGQEDIFIPPNEINGAMQGDQVLVEVEPPKADGRRMGRIVRVMERRNPTVVGVFHYARSDRQQGHSVVPFDERMTQPILIPYGQEVPEVKEAGTPHRVLGAEALRGKRGEAEEQHSGAKAHVDLGGADVWAEARTLQSSPSPGIETQALQSLPSPEVEGRTGLQNASTGVEPAAEKAAVSREREQEHSSAAKAVAHSSSFLRGLKPPPPSEPGGASYDDLEGLVVDVEITSWPTPTRPPMGRVIEVLGDPDDFGVDVEMMIRKHQLPRVFPDKVLAEARSVAHLDLG